MIEVRYEHGLYLPEAGLWLDPPAAKARAFVSHAHADHFARHESVLCSEVTGSLLRSRFRIAAGRLEPSSYHVPVTRDGFRFRLLPAGHIAGSAMLHVTRLSDNATLLYTGDFKVRRSRTAEEIGFLSADTLIMETTFGLPGYELPSPMEVDGGILRFVHDAFADGETPVLLGYSLGKAQEALALLAEHEIPALLHPAAAEMTRACIEAGVPGLPEPVEFDGHAPAGHVLIAPPHATRTNLLRGLKAKRTAMLSGWALQPGAKFRYRVDAMMPLSDHADHPGLLECIQRVKPKRILTVHGYAREFAAELRSRGFDAWCAAGGDQLELPMQAPPRRQVSTRVRQQRALCPLADFSDLCKLVAETGSRVAKSRFIADHLSSLASDEDRAITIAWLAGFPALDRKSPARLDAATLKHALLDIPGAGEERFRSIHHATRDPLRVARLFLNETTLQPQAIDLPTTRAFIARFRESPPSIERTSLLTERLGKLHPAEGETIIRLLAGDLGLGIDHDLLAQAVKTAFKTDAEKLLAVFQTPGHESRASIPTSDHHPAPAPEASDS